MEKFYDSHPKEGETYCENIELEKDPEFAYQDTVVPNTEEIGGKTFSFTPSSLVPSVSSTAEKREMFKLPTAPPLPSTSSPKGKMASKSLEKKTKLEDPDFKLLVYPTYIDVRAIFEGKPKSDGNVAAQQMTSLPLPGYHILLNDDQITYLCELVDRDCQGLSPQEIEATKRMIKAGKEPFDYWKGWIDGFQRGLMSNQIKELNSIVKDMLTITNQLRNEIKEVQEIKAGLDYMIRSSRKKVEDLNKGMESSFSVVVKKILADSGMQLPRIFPSVPPTAGLEFSPSQAMSSSEDQAFATEDLSTQIRIKMILEEAGMQLTRICPSVPPTAAAGLEFSFQAMSSSEDQASATEDLSTQIRIKKMVEEAAEMPLAEAQELAAGFGRILGENVGRDGLSSSQNGVDHL